MAQAEDGTPLSEWPAVSRAIVEQLAFANIKTVEALANCADSNANVIMGFHGLKAKAKNWLEQREGGAAAAKLAEELELRDAQLEILRKQNEELNERLKALESKKKR